MKRLWLPLPLLLVAASAAAAQPPSVVVTIKPIHSLVASVMEGVGRPELLVEGAQDEHTYALRPSQARVLAHADLIVWVGPGLETLMSRPLETLGEKARVLELMAIPDILLLGKRQGGTWEAHEHEDEGEHTDADEAEHEVHNAHIWLDPQNAEVIVKAVERELSELDPAHAIAYAANAEATVERLKGLDEQLKADLKDVRDRPFVVFHDAYHYFENRYDLSAVGSITTDPQVQPSAQRIQAIKSKIRALDAACVFSEPQFEPRLVGTLVEGTDARGGALDAIGAALEPGPELYFSLLQQLAQDLRDCLLRAS